MLMGLRWTSIGRHCTRLNRGKHEEISNKRESVTMSLYTRLLNLYTRFLTKRVIGVIALIDTAIFFLVMNWVFKFDSKLLIMALIAFLGGGNHNSQRRIGLYG